MLKFALILLLFVFGCKATDNYLACENDPVCYAQMQDVRQSSYRLAKTGSGVFIPTVPELIALGVSNLCMFIFGVYKGRRKETI